MFENINMITVGKSDANESIFPMFGQINTEIAQAACEWIISANFSDEPPELLTMFVNTDGGSLTDAWAIVDMMRGSSIPIRTIGLGSVASAGLLILAAGTKGSRILSENCSVMSHQYFWGTAGKAHELMAIQKEYNNIQDRLIRFFKKVTPLTEKEINKQLMPAHDVWLTPEETVKLGLADTVKSMK
jgi:ATP-dependent Clp protease protease subunit